jgi:hypothetical protein
MSFIQLFNRCNKEKIDIGCVNISCVVYYSHSAKRTFAKKCYGKVKYKIRSSKKNS